MLAVWVRVRRGGKYTDWMTLGPKGNLDVSLRDIAHNWIRDNCEPDDVWSVWVGDENERPDQVVK